MKEITDETFEEEIGAGVTLVDFFAQWCGPCHMQTPILETLSDELQGQAKIVKLDIDNNQKMTAQYGVTSVPTLILFKDGSEIERVVGLRDADALRSLITAAV